MERNPPNPFAPLALALAAGGINPQDQSRPGGTDVYTYLTRFPHELTATTDFERVLLVVLAAGTDPRDFAGVDLIAEIVRRQLPDGSFPHDPGGSSGGINDTAFAVIGLSAIDDPALEPVIDRACDWLESAQHESGGWGITPRLSPGSDLTASVIEALRAAGRSAPGEPRAWDYLRTTHDAPSGGFRDSVRGSLGVNTASTAWVVQGMWAAGLEPANWSPGGPSPLDFLASMQDAGGKVRWTRDDDLNPIWMTAYAAPAFAGYPLPIPAVPRAVRPPEPADTAVPEPPATPAPGASGEGAGVSAGGGGDGAPLFSRPEAQSTGETAGGVRRVRRTPDRDATSTKRRRTEPAERAPRPTAASNGSGTAGITRQPGASPAATTRSAGAEQTAGPGSGAAAGNRVSGTVVAAAPRTGADGDGTQDAAAPGLRAGGEASTPLAAGLAALLALGLFSGMTLERRLVDQENAR